MFNAFRQNFSGATLFQLAAELSWLFAAILLVLVAYVSLVASRYVLPLVDELEARLPSVLRVLYLLFTEGYAATRGVALVRTDLCAEAIRLARLVTILTAPHPPPEATALLALMLLHDSRREARLDAAGDLVVLEEQDRSRWNREQIAEALPLVEDALRGGPAPYALQAAIAALHCQAERPEETDWPQIVRLYDVLEDEGRTVLVLELVAAAVAMRDGPAAGLALVDAILGRGELADYQPAHAARAELCRRLGRNAEARAAYGRAIGLTRQAAARRFLERRLGELPAG